MVIGVPLDGTKGRHGESITIPKLLRPMTRVHSVTLCREMMFFSYDHAVLPCQGEREEWILLPLDLAKDCLTLEKYTWKKMIARSSSIPAGKKGEKVPCWDKRPGTWTSGLPPPSLKLGARKMRIELEAKGRQEASVPGTLERKQNRLLKEGYCRQDDFQ